MIGFEIAALILALGIAIGMVILASGWSVGRSDDERKGKP